MLKALLVDDEIHILRNLESVIPWKEYGITIAALARNGLEALELSRQHHPDLVLCDIRMPVMDGLSFIEHLRAEGSQAEVLMLTGYQDFDYARAAIHHRVSEYLLKPIDYDELARAVQRSAEAVRSRHRSKETEARKWDQVMNLAYEKLLMDVLLDYSPLTYDHIALYNETDEQPTAYSLLVADLDGYAAKASVWSEHDRKMWSFAVKNVLQEALSSILFSYAVLQLREGEWCIVIPLAEGRKPNAVVMRRWAEEMQMAVTLHVKQSISISYHPEAVTLSELPRVYKETQRYLLLSAEEGEIVSRPVGGEELATALRPPFWHRVEELVSGLKKADRRQADQALKALMAAMAVRTEDAPAREEQLLHFVLVHLLRELGEMKVLRQEEEALYWRVLQSSSSPKDLADGLSRLTADVLDKLEAKKNSDLAMEAAQEYIDRNLASDLGMEEVAGYVGISCSYFSVKFKQHTGLTFLEYVTGRRMERAKLLLQDEDWSITRIGKTVGYGERRYFTKVFQKVAGCTPSDYREQVMKKTGKEAESDGI